MKLDELIAQMTNPQEFVSLCNAVFTDMYPNHFQVIDGTRGDQGNDGYVANERRMLAIYCPLKPEQRTDADYRKKIRDDLAKAAMLKEQGKYMIDAWTFITPRKLSNDVIAEMRANGEAAGIRVTHLESTFLANELYRRSHLLKGFPRLAMPDVSAKLDLLLEAHGLKEAAPPPATDVTHDPRLEIRDTAAAQRFEELVAGLPSAEAKAELKAIARKTTDPIVETNSILALLRWFDPTEEDKADLLAFADRGIAIAGRMKLPGAEAVLHANKAALIMVDFSSAVIETYVSTLYASALLVEATPMEQRQEQVKRQRTLEEGWRTEISAALDLLRGNRDYDAAATTLVAIGISIGQLALIYRNTGDAEKADRYLSECKKLFMGAKDMYAAMGDKEGVANSVFNLANQVRFHGPAAKAEAVELVKSTIASVDPKWDPLLLAKAKWLLHTLETGKIPDYVHGERRDLGAEPPTA